jgi:hypothetical protein
MEVEILQEVVLVVLEEVEDMLLVLEDQEIVHQQVRHKELMEDKDQVLVQVMQEVEVVLLNQEHQDLVDHRVEMVLFGQLLQLVH